MVHMRVVVDSMEPVISASGMVLAVHAARKIIPYQVYAVRGEDAIYIKELEILPGRNLSFTSVIGGIYRSSLA